MKEAIVLLHNRGDRSQQNLKQRSLLPTMTTIVPDTISSNAIKLNERVSLRLSPTKLPGSVLFSEVVVFLTGTGLDSSGYAQTIPIA
ncbi:hypothetical protein [Phormidesmis priestleyi]|uniref:hypothetical protein n=1 Tax=Phormidesmis priestleyi TaxID=268141 RepID=UPI0012E90D63|nr:hypothetical protein [Phormidesmis priestleyi]